MHIRSFAPVIASARVSRIATKFATALRTTMKGMTSPWSMAHEPRGPALRMA
jgi:hypothetical protein